LKIRFGYELVYGIPFSTPIILALHSQPSHTQHLVRPDIMRTMPAVPLLFFADAYGNTCTRLEAPAGTLHITADGIMEDDGTPEPAYVSAPEIPVRDLPPDVLQYLLASRYCETDLLMNEAWRLFANTAPGWFRVQSVCDFVNREIKFGYQYARPTKTAAETYWERNGVCRDLAHLAIAFCRCLAIPARYCTSYLGDIGVPPVDAPMDFSGCMEVFLGGAWHVFDPRNNTRRIGRIIIARGRDAADVAITTAFGASVLQSFKVWTDEIADSAATASVTGDHSMPGAGRAA
jgi:transglutaminase-like putative cysteine protease